MTHRKHAALINAEPIADGADHIVGEQQVPAILICPSLKRIWAIVVRFEKAFRNDVDDAVVDVERRKAIERRSVASIDDLTSATMSPVELEHQAVLPTLVIVRREADII